MTDSGSHCPEKRDPAQLMAYVEGDLDHAASSEVEAHLRTCAFCSRECESLRRADQLLKVHSEAFHPDEEELYRFVATGDDIGQRIASHLESCQDCSDDVELLREMLQAGAGIPSRAPEMPKSLIRQLERLHTPTPRSLFERLYSSVTELTRLPFRMPVLALGTAAAVVVFVIVSIPLWDTFKQPEYLSPRAPEEQLKMQERKESDVPGRAQSDQAVMQRAPAGSLEVRAKDKRVQEPAASPAAPPRELPAATGSAELEKQKRALSEAKPLAPGKTAPAVRAPKQERYSTDAMLPPQAPVIQDREAAKGERPPRMVYVKPDYVRSRPAGKAEVSEFPREEAPATPRMAPPKADSVKSRPARKKEIAGSLREGAPAPSDSRAGLGDSHIPLAVTVIDPDGRTIPWLKFALPEDLVGRYRLVPEVEAEKQARLGAAVSKESASVSFQDTSRGETRVTVLVRERSGVFDLEAKLFEPGSSAESKRIDAVGVAKEDLADRVTSLVASLLNSGQ